MTWTTDKPTEPGFYWMRKRNVEEAEVVMIRRGIFRRGGPTLNVHTYSGRWGWGLDLDLNPHLFEGAQWYGPLSSPESGTEDSEIEPTILKETE